MERERAEISSVSTRVADAHERVGQAAERLAADGYESHAADLFEVERALQAASRRLEAVLRSMS